MTGTTARYSQPQHARPDLGDPGSAAIDLDAFAAGSSARLPAGWVKPRRTKPVPENRVRYERAAELAKALGPAILAGERIDALLSGNFIFGDVFEALAVETGEPIDDLTLSTLSMGEENVVSLGRMLREGWLGTLNLVVSDYWWAHNRRNAAFLAEHLDVDGRFCLAVAGTHTKVALLAMGERRIVLHGSANLRSSRSIETVTVETSPELYDFHLGWHDAILHNHAVTGKPLRAQALWDHLTEASHVGSQQGPDDRT